MTIARRLTAETITNDQIREPQTESAKHGTRDEPSTILSLIDDGHLSPAQIKARQHCADAINDARAQG